MAITASHLRSNIYKLLDRVLDGETLEIERGGRLIRLSASPERTWIDRLKRREGVVVGDPDDLVSTDWSQDWKPGPL